MGYRKYYSYSYDDIKGEIEGYYHPFLLHNAVMYRLRMYANLFNRDMRKVLLNNDSCCISCLTKENLTIDHVIPISKGGKNDIENTQILCRKCNRLKSDSHG